MFNAPLRTDQGRISAFYILDLLQSDVLYFRSNHIVFEDGQHRILGMQFNSEKMEQLGEVTRDLQTFAREVQAFMHHCQTQSGIFVPTEQLSREAVILLCEQPLTAISLLNLLCTNKIKISRHDNIFLVAADAKVKNAFPALGKQLRAILKCAMQYDGMQSDVNVIFATSQTKDAKSLPIRRRIVATAAAMQNAFDARMLRRADAEIAKLSTDELQKFIDDFTDRGIFTKTAQSLYTLNYDSKQASILYAEHAAAMESDRQLDVIRALVMKQATLRYARVKKAMETCAANISAHDEAAETDASQLEQMTEALQHQQITCDRKNSGFSRFCTVFLFLLFAGCAAFGLYHVIFTLQPQREFVTILPFFSISVKLGLCACAAAALFFLLWAILRIVSRHKANKRLVLLQTHCTQLGQSLQEHTQKATQARNESAIYASYLVLTRTIAKDMQQGDFKGLDLAMHLVPAEARAMQDEKQFSIHAQIIVALCHCGTCTQNELAFLSGAGHEHIRRALYDMIAAGQIILWREDDVQKFCLSQGL